MAIKTNQELAQAVKGMLIMVCMECGAKAEKVIYNKRNRFRELSFNRA